jgi:heavy metal translocating P-type ATPase
MTVSSTDSPSLSQQNSPLFEEFFEMGQQETLSPFIKPESRAWGEHLTLKASILAAVLLVLAFILSFSPREIDHQFSNFLLVAVYFLAGVPSLIEAIEDLASFEINIDILMTLAAFSSVLIGSSMEGALLLVLFALSGSMEDLVTTKAKSAISSLHKLSPTKACIIGDDGKLFERSIKDIAVGTRVLVKSGQVVPLDGTVIDGISSLSLVHLTGESVPVTKKVGDDVPAGARNLEGTLTISVQRTSSDSTLARIIQLVTQAQEERPLLQRWFDKLSKSYAISIILLALLFGLTLPMFITGMPYLGIEGSVYRALAFLIAASPCALIIALPIAYLSAIGVCARQGILLKGGITLDALAKSTTIAFDKTGTLTTGNLTLEGIQGFGTLGSADEERALAIAYALERNAVHPIAKAVVDYAQERHVPVIALEDFEAVPGYGLRATVMLPEGNQSAYIGKPDYILPKMGQTEAAPLASHIDTLQNDGKLIAVLLLGAQVFVLRFRDTLRPNILATVEELRRQDLRLVMLTGDHKTSAKKVAAELGFDEYLADLRPEDKLKYVSEMAATQGLAMVGDGINDAPALARATVGICMGKVGSTTAIDAADVVLLNDNIELLSWLINKAHQTQRIVKQNLALATMAILIASIPALVGWVPLWLAVVMHEGGTILVGLNGLRLLRK